MARSSTRFTESWNTLVPGKSSRSIGVMSMSFGGQQIDRHDDGHYTACALVPVGNKQRWHHFDDEKVVKMARGDLPRHENGALFFLRRE